MAYGIRGFYEEPLVFPEIMSDEELHAVEESMSVGALPRFQPIRVIRKAHPEIAAELEKMWGYQGLELYVERLVRESSAPFASPVLNALVSLARHHAENRKDLGKIDVWVVDRPTPEGR